MTADSTMTGAMPRVDAAAIPPAATVEDSAPLRQAIKLFLEHGCLLVDNA